MVAKLGGSVARARKLRRDATDVEKKLWLHLRNRQADQIKFRRQVPIRRYIVDFCCLDAKLIVELDGDQHAENAHDEERTRYLAARGFSVLRFWNHEVSQNLDGVIETIIFRARMRSPSSRNKCGAGSIFSPRERKSLRSMGATPLDLGSPQR